MMKPAPPHPGPPPFKGIPPYWTKGIEGWIDLQRDFGV